MMPTRFRLLATFRRLLVERRPLGIWVLVGSLIAGCWVLPGLAQQSSNTESQQGRQLSLYDQLTVGLRATTKEDRAFIRKVVRKVEQGKLPRSLVDSTFIWAREKAESKSATRRLRPMVYFQPGMTMRAKQLGVSLETRSKPNSATTP